MDRALLVALVAAVSGSETVAIGGRRREPAPTWNTNEEIQSQVARLV